MPRIIHPSKRYLSCGLSLRRDMLDSLRFIAECEGGIATSQVMQELLKGPIKRRLEQIRREKGLIFPPQEPGDSSSPGPGSQSQAPAPQEEQMV
jgi:hypothetical protein